MSAFSGGLQSHNMSVFSGGMQSPNMSATNGVHSPLFNNAGVQSDSSKIFTYLGCLVELAKNFVSSHKVQSMVAE